jgi:hypothetical protein
LGLSKSVVLDDYSGGDLMKGLDRIHGDRRAEKRYAYEMPLRFQVTSGTPYAGAGLTVNLGRKGILLQTEALPPKDAEIELRIEWPFRLQNVCDLELYVWGRVLRSDERGTVVTMRRYEFRTRGARSFEQALDQACASASEEHWNMVA